MVLTKQALPSVIKQAPTKCAAQFKGTDSIGSYLREIGRVPLLTQEQEVHYGRQVQQMICLLEAKEALTKNLCYEPTSAEWALHVHLTEIELHQILRQGQRAKQKMVEANLRLVVSLAKKYQKRGLEISDLIQEGSLGLQRGVEKFDPTRGYKFSTYAYWWISQSMTRAIATQSRTIRLPSHITEKLNKIKKVQRQLSQELGRIPKISELAEALELSSDQVKQYLIWKQETISLNLKVGDDKNTELAELLQDTSETPSDFVVASSLPIEVERLMAELTSKQQEILTLRFGLADEPPLTLAKISDRLNLSRERIRQIEQKALKKLRQTHQELQPSSNEGWNPHSTGDYSDCTTDYSIGHQQLSLFDIDALLATTATAL